ncbi:MAG: DUF1858 domain-containing protein [bacterium]
MDSTMNWINPKTMIPDLLQAAPQARPVLDRYGLRGCGGPLGPMETLEFFAKAHEVSMEGLLTELCAAVANGAGSNPPAARPVPPIPELETRPEDAIYRPFFKAGIAVALTLGAVWGAYLLLRIAIAGSFTAIGYHEVNAHGHAQIFGWVGLFVMGFAYQAFPRFKHASLAYPRLAFMTLWMMVIGLVTRSVLEPVSVLVQALRGAPILASVLEVAAIGMFVWIIGMTWRRSGKPLAYYDYYIISALAWFLIQAVYETVLFIATISAPGREQLLHLIATWQAPLREIQIHGFAMMMILGVSQRIFHNFYGFSSPDVHRSRIALWGLNLGLVGEITGFILMRTSAHAWAALWYGSILLLAASVAFLVADWKIFSHPEERDRNLKFLRAAYVWLFISLAMLVLLPVYQWVILPAFAPAGEAVATGFSHACYGAIRHAITVGFISLMIVGVAAKVVPTLNGVDLRSLAQLWIPFVLINTGCALRVAGQTLTDFSPAFFPLAGISGWLEVSGLAVWGAHLLQVMAGRARLRNPRHVLAGRYTPLSRQAPIAATSLVGDVLDAYPNLVKTFVAFGFTPLQNPVLRATIARTVTIQAACRKLGVDVNEMLQALNAARERATPARADTPRLYQISLDPVK